MAGRRDKADKASVKFWRSVIAWWTGHAHGNVTPIMAIMLVPLIGAFGVATEASGWFSVQRSEQNAADSAALAAATNNTGGLTPHNWDTEAQGVAARYGYVNGSDNVTVTPSYPVACPAPWTGSCYQVTVSRNVPIRLIRLVGYQGDVAMGGGRGKTVTAIALARSTGNGTYCITALGTADDAIKFSGTPNLDLAGCDISSAGGGSCNGNSGDTVGHAYVTTAGDAKNCGPNEIVGAPPGDIYAGLAVNIVDPPATACPAISGTVTWTTNVSCTGNLSITAGSTVNVTGEVVLTIKNGDLVTGGTLKSTGTGHLTVIFTGDNAHSHIFTGSGMFDFAAPTSGTWSGIAIYQNPSMTSIVDVGDVGNSPTYNVTGLLYMPNANVVVKGAINHKSGGDNCMAIVVKTVDIRGTGSIFGSPTSECQRAGLVLQGSPGSGSGPLLVQ